ncbi:hypothetical protein BC628DRAFT_730208 [Trametes gibbosa]|nr:hypothetical protein BC628DRAFT_730208 [Trametes gibbosa]
MFSRMTKWYSISFVPSTTIALLVTLSITSAPELTLLYTKPSHFRTTSVCVSKAVPLCAEPLGLCLALGSTALSGYTRLSTHKDEETTLTLLLLLRYSRRYSLCSRRSSCQTN